jgi:hypothetical protein
VTGTHPSGTGARAKRAISAGARATGGKRPPLRGDASRGQPMQRSQDGSDTVKRARAADKTNR